MNNFKIKKSSIVCFLVVLSVSILGIVSNGYTADSNAAVVVQPPYLSYATKFICGPTPAATSTTEGSDAVKGMYKTAVNIHNPNPVPVVFLKKAVVAYPERNTNRGPISQIKTEQLEPDGAMEVDCTDITKTLFAGVVLPTHIEGFVVIMVPADAASGTMRELDVWGKYTARHRTGAGGIADVSTDVESLEMEQVLPRRITQ
ncbi:MAG: hypothetical protein PH343_05120 [Nitrospira sp.]|nr:hypothetical protein [Nitrospira sp.]